jgi:hypothetical protein
MKLCSANERSAAICHPLLGGTIRSQHLYISKYELKMV